MSRAFVSALLLIVVACAPISDGTDFRAISSDEEWEEYHHHAKVTDSAWFTLTQSNTDLCAPRCALAIKLGPATGMGAFTRSNVNPPEIWITFPLMRFLENEDEVAMLIAHEWSHILLGHAAVYDALGAKVAELQADCLGAILAARAGYDVEAGAQALRRMALTPNGILHTLSGGVTHPDFGSRYRTTISAGSKANKLSKDGIRRICGDVP